MKTFVRLIRRYVLAAVGIVLLLLFSGVAVLGWLGWQEGCRLPQREYSSSEIADSMVETAEGLAFGTERTPQEWMNGYEWAMVLDDVGNIRWSYGLPQELNHAYTPGDIAKFARWYLADYPVFCWTESYGLFVIGLPKGSLWKYSIYSSPDLALSMVRVLPAAALGLLMLGLVLCFWLSWRGAKRLETVANGLDALAQGQTVRLPTDGFAGELAEKLKEHVTGFGVEIARGKVKGISLDGEWKIVHTKKADYRGKAVILAAGAVHRKLEVPGEEELAGMGVSYCATCDGAFFKDKTVAVVGGGDVAVEDAIFLARGCKQVYLIHRRDQLRAAQVLQDALKDFHNITCIWDTTVEKIGGEQQVQWITLKQTKTAEKYQLDVDGVFIAVGTVPDTGFVKELVDLDEHGYIKAGEDGRTGVSGIYAAGDIRTKELRQIITAAADGANCVNSAQQDLYKR